MKIKKNKLAFPTLASTRGDKKSLEERNPKYKTQSCTLLPSWLHFFFLTVESFPQDIEFMNWIEHE